MDETMKVYTESINQKLTLLRDACQQALDFNKCEQSFYNIAYNLSGLLDGHEPDSDPEEYIQGIVASLESLADLSVNYVDGI